MAEFTANAPQTIAVGSNVLFTDTVIKPCPAVTHREGSGIFTLRGGKRFLVLFNANVSGATAGTELDLAITIAGEELPATRMASTPAVADDLNNVSAQVYITVPACCCFTIGIRNVGTTAITVENANLILIKEEV